MTAQPIARGPGPTWLRITLAVIAAVYLFALYKHGWVPQPARYFIDATALFPNADRVAQEYRLEGYSCGRKRWELMDPRAYFPLRGDDKESRFQRLMHFYGKERTVMWALDDYIVGRHPDVDDGIDGPIGGIQVIDFTRPIPEVGSEIERYEYKPLSPMPREREKFGYRTVMGCKPDDEADHKCEPQRTLTARCR